tara:strand:+ start:1510 stop:2505 length:996 start_codon:yes stop_codon:yes gene_type:complete
MYAKQLEEFLTNMITAKLPVLVKGKPGGGKTSIIKLVGKKLKQKVRIKHPVVDEPIDYKGMPSIQGDVAKFLPFGDLNELITTKEDLIVFFDDLGQASPAVQAALMQLFLERRINGHMISPTVTFVAATNRQQDRAGVSGMLEPVKSRFVTIVELETKLDDWMEWAIQNNLSPMLRSFFNFRPNLLHDFKPTGDLVNSPAPRTAHNIDKMMKAGIPEAVFYEVIAGAAGEGFAAEFSAYVKFHNELPDIKQILTDPMEATVPENIGVQYALCGKLVEEATKANVANIIKYVGRLSKEFEIFLTRDIAISKPECAKTTAFIAWLGKNDKVMI